MIDAQGLVKIYRRGREEIMALKGIDFRIEKNEFVVFFGPSGAGKTTTLNLIGGMDLPDRGQLKVLEHRLSMNELARYRREQVGFVFSEFCLIPTLTAIENVAMPLLWTSRHNPKKSRDLLGMVGLEHRMNHYPKELSGGEMQRVAIARALINEPKILLADEPTANLDTKTRDSVIDLFEKLNRESGITIILATHDAELVHGTFRIIRLEDGRII